ncbi:endonuclease domain-containing protein [Cutibacterium sp. V947]|uniref:endonuclease domain-containing protein n=1 Tax=unclassified Cutibacterium TaxID=2649671 RepID=UPI003EE3D4BD
MSTTRLTEIAVPAQLCLGGVVSTAALMGSGMSKAKIDTARRHGSIIRLRQGWWALPSADPNVVSAVRAGGVLGCVSALKMMGVWSPLDSRVHCRGHREPPSPAVRSCPAPRRAAPIIAVDPPDIAVQSVVRCLGHDEAVAVLDSVVRKGLLTHEGLEERLLPIPAGRRILADLDWADSGTESLVRCRLRRLGLAVRTQVSINDVGRVDMLVGDRLVIEVDSVAHHTDLAAYSNDRRRDLELVSRGYIVVRIPWHQVMYDWDRVEPRILEIVSAGDHRGHVRAG